MTAKIKGPARQALEVLAGEVRHKDANHLTGVKNATETSVKVIVGAMAVPVGLLAILEGPFLAAEYLATAGEGAAVWGSVVGFVAREPQFAGAVSEIIVGLGLEAVDLGPEEFLRSLTTKEGFALLVLELAGAGAARFVHRGPGTQPPRSVREELRGGLRSVRAVKRKAVRLWKNTRRGGTGGAGGGMEPAYAGAGARGGTGASRTAAGTAGHVPEVDAGSGHLHQAQTQGSGSTPGGNRHADRVRAGVNNIDQPLDNPHPQAASEGHMHADHGAHTTDAQQAHRIETGVTPGGRVAKPPRTSTRFRTPEAELEAVGRARRQLDLASPPTTKSNGDPNRHIVIVSSADPRGFASGYHERRIDATGKPILRADGSRVSGYRPGILRRAKVIFEWVPSTRKWEVVTGYAIQ